MSNTTQTSINIISQYVKDLSFENPKAPMSLTQSTIKQPKINIDINIEVRKLHEDDNTSYEVTLYIKTDATNEDTTLFISEIKYAGIVKVQNFKEKETAILLQVYAPALLFPYARQIISNNVQDGGFPPLRIQPIDFNQLYQQKLKKEK